MDDFNSKQWVLITGASTGIGRATASYLSSRGYGVYACARKQKDLDELDKIENVVPVSLDVTKRDDIDAAFKMISDRNTGLYALVNNAGISVPGALMEMAEDDIVRNLDVNLLGIHRVTRAFFPLISQAQGRIVMISSVLGLIAMPFNGPYCLSKFALEGYSDSLRRELLLTDVRVIIIEPGLIKTSIYDKADETLKAFKATGKESQFLKPGIKAGERFLHMAKTRGIDPVEVARTVHTAITSRNPKTRYQITENNLQYWILKSLSDKKIDQILLKDYEI